MERPPRIDEEHGAAQRLDLPSCRARSLDVLQLGYATRWSCANAAQFIVNGARFSKNGAFLRDLPLTARAKTSQFARLRRGDFRAILF